MKTWLQACAALVAVFLAGCVDYPVSPDYGGYPGTYPNGAYPGGYPPNGGYPDGGYYPNGNTRRLLVIPTVTAKPCAANPRTTTRGIAMSTPAAASS